MNKRISYKQARSLLKKPRKRTKFNNTIVDTPAGRFHSKKEYARYLVLAGQEDTGGISELNRQVPFALHVGDTKVCNYIADFTYRDKKNRYIVEDVKGLITPLYRLKKKMLRAEYGIEVLET